MQALTPNPTLPQPDTSRGRFDKVRILADDLTGACDAAAAFLPAGHEVRVWLGAGATHPSSEPVQAFNTASRQLNSAAAADAVFRAALAIPTDARTLWLKKVDSAGRGEIPAEVLAAHKALATRAVLFAPSFPAAGRTVRGGTLFVEDATGNTTETHLVSQFQQHAPTVHISQPHLELDGAATVLVCDASTQVDLEALAKIDTPGILFAGSAGLAKALVAVHFPPNPTQAETRPRASRPITICGSRHPVTSLQLDHLAQALTEHPLIQIAAQADDEAILLTQFSHHCTDALILTGGDTALLVLQTLGAHSILLRGEMFPGIPWGLIQGGLADGRIVVTKSGGFGNADSLTRIVQQLTGVTSE